MIEVHSIITEFVCAFFIALLVILSFFSFKFILRFFKSECLEVEPQGCSSNELSKTQNKAKCSDLKQCVTAYISQSEAYEQLERRERNPKDFIDEKLLKIQSKQTEKMEEKIHDLEQENKKLSKLLKDGIGKEKILKNAEAVCKADTVARVRQRIRFELTKVGGFPVEIAEAIENALQAVEEENQNG